MAICLIPGISDLYEVVVLTESPDELAIETFHMVGPDRDSIERYEWEKMLEGQTAQNQRVRSVAALPKTLAPIAQEVKRINCTTAPLSGPDTSDRLTVNPSMVSTLRKERAKYGAYTGPLSAGEPNAYVIFGGRYFGGYLFPGGRKVYRLPMETVLEQSEPRVFAIIMNELIKRILAPAFPDRSFAVKRYQNQKNARLGLPHLKTGRLSLWMDGGQIEEETLEQLLKMVALVEYAEVPDPVATLREVMELYRTILEKQRQKPSSYSQSGLDEWFDMPSMSPRERRTYARTWLRTKSPDKALKAVFPNVRGGGRSIREAMSVISSGNPEWGGSVSEAKRIMNFSPYSAAELVQFAKRAGSGTRPEGTIRSDLPVAEAARQLADQYRAYQRAMEQGAQLFDPLGAGSHLLDVERGGQYLQLTAAELRDLIYKKKFTRRDVDLLYDTIRTVQENEGDFPLTREGLLYMQHIRDRRWRQVVRDHDGVMALSEQYRQARWERQKAEQLAGLTQVRKITAALDFLPGITPLLTDTDFEREGKRMKHCIAGYARSPHYHNFHIQHPDTGDHSTLQLDLNGNIQQHYGVRNSYVSSTQKEYAKEFVNLNKSRRKFSATSKDDLDTLSNRLLAPIDLDLDDDDDDWDIADDYADGNIP